MNDAEFVFNQDIAEKKKTGTGAYHKYRGGGKYVKMPSDNLSRKEKEALNGEVTTYELNKPMVWKEYKAMPRTIQKEYCEGLMRKFNVGPLAMSKMFGVTDGAVTRELKMLDIKVKGKHVPNEEWGAFLAGTTEKAKEEPIKEEPPEEKPMYVAHMLSIEKREYPVYPMSGTMSFYGSVEQVAQTMFHIIKGKAKFTVSWEVDK